MAIGRFDVAVALVQDLDPALGVFEPAVAEPGEVHAAFVELQRRLERQVALLELLDDRLELGDRRLEVLNGRRFHCLW